jgi:hypothetical protein
MFFNERKWHDDRQAKKLPTRTEVVRKINTIRGKHKERERKSRIDMHVC